MAEINPLLPNERNRKRESNVIVDSLSSTSVSAITSEIHPYTTTDPPADISSYQSHHHSRPNYDLATTNTNYALTKPPSRRPPNPRSPNSSRSKGDKIGSYNLDYTGKIPLASSGIFLFLAFGVLLALLAIAVSAYLVLTTEGDKIEDENHSDLSNIVLPLIVYIMNAVECSLFYLEARMFQMKGYSQLFQDASQLSKINFRFVSMYFVLTYAVYAFLLHHVHYFTHPHDMDIIFLAVWCFGYVFIIGCLCQFGEKLYVHNRDRPKPDLFFPHPNNENYIQNSPNVNRPPHRNAATLPVADEQTEVIQKLYKDKSTLIRQLNTWKRKYHVIKSELQQIQSDNASLLDAQGGAAFSGGGLMHNDVAELRKQIGKLRSKLRGEREKAKTLHTQIETKKTMLDAQIAETQQLRVVSQNKDDRISQLMNEKESLERGIHACNDQKDDLSLLYQVKEQEVEIAKKENERLRKRLQSMSLQHVHNF